MTAPAQGISAKGTLIQREDSPGAGTYTTIARMKDINYSRKLKMGDGTTHDSPSRMEQGIPLTEKGTIQFQGLFLPLESTHETLQSDYDAGLPINYRLIFPPLTAGGTKKRLTFPVIITDVAEPAKVGAELQINFAVEMQDLPVVDTV